MSSAKLGVRVTHSAFVWPQIRSDSCTVTVLVCIDGDAAVICPIPVDIHF